MIPYRLLGSAPTPDGSTLTLHEHDGDFYLKYNGRQLMTTRATTSERMLAELGCKGLHRHRVPRVLIGGLGLGFTLKQVLEMVGPQAEVEVSELVPEVITWNRTFLSGVNGQLLEDGRVKIHQEDVFATIKRGAKDPYDAILLDVDNGPTSYVQKDNERIYRQKGFRMLEKALRPHGRIAFWSADKEPDFIPQLHRAGFVASEHEAKSHETAKRAAHRIYVAERRQFQPVEEEAAPLGRPPRRGGDGRQHRPARRTAR